MPIVGAMKRIVPIAIDLIAVLLFAINGRASHGGSLDVAGIFGTFWPFGAALAVGWAVVVLLGKVGLGLREFFIIWLVTVAGGMALRIASGGGTALPFVIVTTLVLGLFLGGWRLVTHLAGRRKNRA